MSLSLFFLSHRGTQSYTRTATLCPCTTLFRSIRSVPLLDEVALRQHVFPFETAALPLAWYHPYPLKCHRLRLGEFPRVLDVIPDAVYHLPELPLDAFGVMHVVQPDAVFYPPQLTAVSVGFEVADPGDFFANTHGK